VPLLRKKCDIFFLSKLDIDKYACKFAILKLNSVQNIFEFEFPDLRKYEMSIKDFFPEEKFCESKTLFDSFSKLIVKYLEKSAENKADYFVGITEVGIDKGEDLFWITDKDKAIITTKGWQKNFSPPSVFVYLVQSLASVLVVLSSNAESKTPIHEHQNSRGCIFDYAWDKKDNKVDVSLGYICDECKSLIETALGHQFLSTIEDLCSTKCLGDIETKGSPAYELKKFFRVDIEKDSGFNKTRWEKAKEVLSRWTEQILIGTIGGILIALVTYLYLSR
jgi:hypothetical protein